MRSNEGTRKVDDMAATPLIIIGAGGLGREVAWLVEDINEDSRTFEFLGFLDDSVQDTPEGYPILGTTEDWLKRPEPGVHVVCAVGNPLARYEIVREFASRHIPFATLIHPTVRRSRWVEFGPGTIVCVNTSFTTNVRVGAHALFNPDCTVGHDVDVADFSSLMPGVHISGDVVLGEGTYFGVGSVVINKVKVGAWSIVGAGAVVTRDVPAGVVTVGVPAKPIKQNSRVPKEFELPSYKD